MKIQPVIGRVHSIETLGTRDGPGLRCVFFLAGCNFRCQFCQNADTWSVAGSSRMTIAEAVDRILPLLPYLRQAGGGITVSGGEPTQQPEFVQKLFQAAHSLGLTTALDTNGACASAQSQALLAVTDTVLLDVKASSEALHRRLTGHSLASTLAFGKLAAQGTARLVIRRVLLPGINDTPGEMERLADYALSLAKVPEIELIAYHRLGVHKWKELGLRYPLARLKPPAVAVWKRAAKRLEARGLKVVRG